MILFEEDWYKKHPEAIADYSTTNSSFVAVVQLFKDMGLNNYDFPLALHNKDLVGVDPHNENLDEDTFNMVLIEAAENIWYYLRECAMIIPISGTTPIRFTAHRGNIAMTWLAMNHITNLHIQVRQTGKSVGADHIMLWCMLVGTKNTSAGLYTKDDPLRTKNISRYKAMYGLLPAPLKLRSKKEPGGDEKFVVTINSNEVETAVAQNSLVGAKNIFRGSTKPIIQIDEIAHIKLIEHSLSPMLASTTEARRQAEIVGSPYYLLFTTTPGYLHTPHGSFMFEFYNESFMFTEKLYDCTNLKETEKIISVNNGGRVRVVTEFNHRQLGRTDEWLSEQINITGSKGDDLESDWLLKWPSGSSTSPLSPNILKQIADNVKKDFKTNIYPNGFIVREYCDEVRSKEIRKNRSIVVAVDPSDAVGRDDMALIACDPYTGETLLAADINETNIIVYSEWLLTLMTEFPQSIFIIERRGSGPSVIDNLLRLLPIHSIDPFRRMFNWMTNDYEINSKYRSVVGAQLSIRDKNLYMQTDVRTSFGFATSKSGRASRDTLYGSILSAATKYLTTVIRDSKLSGQLLHLTVKNGRVDHVSGGHDDMVIAWLLIYWFLTMADNHKIYGIDTRRILSNVSGNGPDNNYDGDKKQQALQNFLQAEITSIISEMENESVPLMFDRLQNKLDRYLKVYSPSTSGALTLREITEKIEYMKKLKKSIRR